MNTQATTAAKKSNAAARKAAAAAKFGDNPVVDAPEAGATVEAPAAAPVDPAKTGLGLKKAKAATKRASRAVVVKPEGETAVEQMAEAVNTLQAKAEAATKRKAAKAAKAAEPEFVPVVVKDGNNHSAIAVASNGRTVELIPMDSAGMTVVKLSRDRFAADYQPMQDYPVGKAAKVYLTQTIALDPKARAVLEVLAAAEADKPIASGELVALMSKHDSEAALQTVPANGEGAVADAPKAGRKARSAAPKADREGKPTGSRAPAAELAKTIVAGDVKVTSKVQPGSFRAARHEYIVSMAGKTVAEVLGASTVEGKRGIAYRDVQFALSNGFIKLA
jgi:hypothetical protein